MDFFKYLLCLETVIIVWNIVGYISSEFIEKIYPKHAFLSDLTRSFFIHTNIIWIFLWIVGCVMLYS